MCSPMEIMAKRIKVISLKDDKNLEIVIVAKGM